MGKCRLGIRRAGLAPLILTLILLAACPGPLAAGGRGERPDPRPAAAGGAGEGAGDADSGIADIGVADGARGRARPRGVPPDSRIRRAVLDQLAGDDRVQAVLADAIVQEGRVTLLGSVAALSGREAAEQGVRGLPGVRSVDNRLQVNAGAAPPPDEAIARRIRMMLDWCPEVDDLSEVLVLVAGGVVTLQGHTEALWKKERIGAIASIPEGVRRVDNEITVEPPEPAGDERIGRDLLAALGRSVPEAVGRVAVGVAGGKVTLAGAVPSGAVRRAALEAASSCRGVVAVEDRLYVE